MTIQLIEQAYPVRRTLRGGDSLQADANTVIKFKVGNVDILSEKVPAGKTWRLVVNVSIEETNV